MKITTLENTIKTLIKSTENELWEHDKQNNSGMYQDEPEITRLRGVLDGYEEIQKLVIKLNKN